MLSLWFWMTGSRATARGCQGEPGLDARKQRQHVRPPAKGPLTETVWTARTGTKGWARVYKKICRINQIILEIIAPVILL